ncbi:thio(seleno)oxazole modification radical SAM maturase SbtM [bacterium]
MNSRQTKKFDRIYLSTRSILGPEAWNRLIKAYADLEAPETFPDCIHSLNSKHILPDYRPDLTRLEWTVHSIKKIKNKIPDIKDRMRVNPVMEILHLSWRCSHTLTADREDSPPLPQPGEEWAVIWRNPRSGSVHVEAASPEDLLCLKMVAEDIPEAVITQSGEITPRKLEKILQNSIDKGILLAPASRIRRDLSFYPGGTDLPERFFSSQYFTLQWHITHTCDLHCKHCYDRSKRTAVTMDQGIQILNDLKSFCRNRYVKGHVCFSGGNPLLHPHFLKLYTAAVERNFSTSILGNPAPRKQIEDIIAIQKPEYFQVSLEGLPEHNDWIRGKGNFTRVVEFLGVLRDLNLSSAVMLTLTGDNMDQILPLAERLRGHTDHFTFNRLSPVGEGANLQLPDKKTFAVFLEKYIEVTRSNPILGIKDNLINIIYESQGIAPSGGCTGFGCGAAFSFFAVLPDGETHACRKFPSPIGNVLKQSLAEIYDSTEAEQYRRGTSACRECKLKPVCGGCLSIIHGYGLDITRDMDPHCFIDDI